MDNPAYYNELFQQYLSGNLTSEQKEELGEYLASREATRNILAQLKEDFENKETLPNRITAEQSARIQKALLSQIGGGKVVPISGRKRIYYVAAAMLALLIGAGFFLLKDRFSANNLPVVAISNPDSIVPGGNNAILTLGDGSTVALNDYTASNIALKAGIIIEKLPNGEIVYKAVFDSTNLAKTGTPVFNTIQTPRGGECRLVLPDGSAVWLNSASSIRFPQFFSGHERNVFVNGEVYFEVAHNKAMPFKVTTGPQTLEVLGTHFSVDASNNYSVIKTTLFEGSVRLSNGKDSRILKPRQESKLIAGKGGFVVTDLAGAKTEPDWTEGYFSFDDADFITIQEQLEKWYDVAFVYDNVPQNHFYGRIKRSSKISDVLGMMEIVAKNIHFKIEGRKIFVMEK